MAAGGEIKGVGAEVMCAGMPRGRPAALAAPAGSGVRTDHRPGGSAYPFTRCRDRLEDAARHQGRSLYSEKGQ